MTQWYYSQSGQQAGPVSASDLQRMLQAGQLTSADLVWRDGMAQWQPVSTVPELAGSTAPAPPQAPSYAQPQYGQPAYGQPAYGQPYPASPLGYPAQYPYGPQKRRSGGVTAVGIISIIWGGLFMLCAGITSLLVLSNPNGAMDKLDGIQKVIPFISLILHTCIAASGVGTLMLRKWAKVLIWIVTVPLAGMYLFNLVTAFNTPVNNLPPGAEAGRAIGAITVCVLGIGWPVFLCFFYNQPNVKRQFEAASQGG